MLGGTLPCTKREAVQIAAVHLLLDTLREDKNKKQKTATTDDPSKFLKVIMMTITSVLIVFC